jgi:hypothetical protein
MNEYLGMYILEFGNNHQHFTQGQLEQYLSSKGINVGDPHIRNLLGAFISEYFHRVGHPSEGLLAIRLTGHMQYIDYLELKEARQSAQEAKRDALNAMKITKWSLIISAGLTVISIFIAIQANIITSGQTITSEEKEETRKNDSINIQLQRELIVKTDSLFKVEKELLNIAKRKM